MEHHISLCFKVFIDKSKREIRVYKNNCDKLGILWILKLNLFLLNFPTNSNLKKISNK